MLLPQAASQLALAEREFPSSLFLRPTEESGNEVNRIGERSSGESQYTQSFLNRKWQVGKVPITIDTWLLLRGFVAKLGRWIENGHMNVLERKSSQIPESSSHISNYLPNLVSISTSAPLPLPT